MGICFVFVFFVVPSHPGRNRKKSVYTSYSTSTPTTHCILYILIIYSVELPGGTPLYTWWEWGGGGGQRLVCTLAEY